MVKNSVLKKIKDNGFDEEDLVALSFGALIDIGEQLREIDGNFDGAIKCFNMALADAEYRHSNNGISVVLGQLGLTYRHMGKLDEAEGCYRKMLENAMVRTKEAEALRHLSDLDYLRGDYEKGLKKAKNAYNIALTAYRSDLVWFSHGVTKIQIALLKQWLEREERDLKNVLVNPTISNLKRRVWQTGYLGDKAKVFMLSPFGWFHGIRAAFLARIHNLALRKKR